MGRFIRKPISNIGEIFFSYDIVSLFLVGKKKLCHYYDIVYLFLVGKNSYVVIMTEEKNISPMLLIGFHRFTTMANV